jgi:hypothetical protein
MSLKFCDRLKESPEDMFEVHITGDSSYKICRVWINTLDRKDGSFIVRYKTYHTCHNFKIRITYSGVDVGASPYLIKGKLMLLRMCSLPGIRVFQVQKVLKFTSHPKVLKVCLYKTNVFRMFCMIMNYIST